nr:MAG TPA: hypothetical protein [Caudoviricetes sp.]
MYKYKITRETLLKLLPFLCAASYAFGILLIVLCVDSKYPIVGSLMGSLCIIIGTISLVGYAKIKDEVEKEKKEQAKNNASRDNNLNCDKSTNNATSTEKLIDCNPNHFYDIYTPTNTLRKLITNTVLSFNKENGSNISSQTVIDLFFKKYHKEIPRLTTEKIYNKLYGFKAYIYMCCFMLTDNRYAEMKKQFASDFDIDIPEGCKEFYQIMDDVYIDKSLEYLQDSLEKAENIDDLPEEGLSALEIIDETISRFMKKNHLSKENFIKEKRK